MIINIYGCSWSHGDEYPFDSWASEFAKLIPHYTINNYAYTGSSLAFSCYMLDKTYNSDAINIFQLTGPARFVSWNDVDYDSQSFLKFKNYRCFKKEIKMQYHFPGQTTSFCNEYFPLFTKPLEHIQTKSYIEFAKLRSSYTFAQRHNYDEVDCIHSILAKQYDEFLSNDNFHFNLQGHKWLAQFILDKLIERNLIS
jgi:hypothetical protein